MSAVGAALSVNVIDLCPLFIDGCVVCYQRAGISARSLGIQRTDYSIAQVVSELVIVGPTYPEPRQFDTSRLIIARSPRSKIIIITPSATDPAVQSDAAYIGVAACLEHTVSCGRLLTTTAQVARGARLLPVEASCQSPGLVPLSPRERQILALVDSGRSDCVIAEALRLRTATVRNHVQRALEKLDVHNRRDAITRARRLGWLDVMTPRS